MTSRRSTWLVVLSFVAFGAAGCENRTPPSGARAIVPADYLDKQRTKIEQIKASMKSRSLNQHGVRR
jgi:hypothetical protein